MMSVEINGNTLRALIDSDSCAQTVRSLKQY